MSRLEEKLKELGYEQCRSRDYDLKNLTTYLKAIPNNHILIYFNPESNSVDYYKVVPHYAFHNQEDVDFLQDSMNTLKKDLEILKVELTK